MSLNHEVCVSPKDIPFVNGSIDDFTDCIDFTKQYQKSCGLIDSNTGVVGEENKKEKNEEEEKEAKEIEVESLEGPLGKGKVARSGDNESGGEQHPMEPDVSITVEELRVDSHMGVKVKENCLKSVESSKKKSVKQKLVKKNHLKLPINKNIKRKVSLFKFKNGKYVRKKNEAFQYQGIQSNIKFKCYKCSYSDFCTIAELQAHQRKCITGTPEFQTPSESGTFSNPSGSNFRITRKVYLCSACGSYYENWNLFLHMKEIHKRHICLYCLGMFSQPDKLAQHLQAKHGVVEQNVSSTEDFYKTYRGSCYLVCVSCEAMFSEQENFYEHFCSAEESGPCPLCGLQGAHFPTCRRAFSDRSAEPSPEKSHPALGKKLNGKKKKVKANKKSKDVFKVVNSEHNGEISVIVRKQNSSENLEPALDGRSRDYFSGTKDSGEKSSTSPRNSNEDLVLAKQYTEKMLLLYRPNKPSEKIISSIQSIEDSINRVVESSRLSNDGGKNNEEDAGEVEEEETGTIAPNYALVEDEEEEEDTNFDPSEENASAENPSSNSEHRVPPPSSGDPASHELCKEKSEPEEKPKSLDIAYVNGTANIENQAMSDCESTDSEKLTIAFDQPSDQITGEKNSEADAEMTGERNIDHIPMATPGTPYICVPLKEDSQEVKVLIKEFVKVSCWNCVYCSHAKRIAVNGKQLALHVLAEHRFACVPETASDEDKENSALSVTRKLKSSLASLENCFFNTDTFDSEDKECWKANDRIYECFHCLFATYVHKELYSHNRKMHQKAVFLCIMCKSNFYNYSELLCHLCPGIYIAGQVINPDITYRCFLCNVDPLPSSFRLMVHLRRRHNSCDICFDLSSNQFQLSTHVWKHKLSHMCYRCGIAYRNKPDITKHLFWKHGTESVLCKKCLQKKWPHVYHFCVPPNSFICDECSVSLKSAVALKVHKRLHSGDYPYLCTKCEEKFISRKLLAKHMEKHEEEANKAPETDVPETESEKNNSHLDDSKGSELGVNGTDDAEKKPEKEKKPKKRKVITDVFDLPPVNLSESDDSEPEEPEVKTKDSEPQFPIDEPQMSNGYLNGNVQKEESSLTQIVDGVWNDFQNYLVAKDMPKTFRPGSPFKNMTLSRIKEIMLSDHDYHIIPSGTAQGVESTLQEPEKCTENSKKAGLDHDYCNNASKSCKSKTKQKTKHREDASKSSSSDSSSDSDSSCSCGSNCSCSSGSSSSTSSKDSDSDTREKKKQKKSSRESKLAKEEGEQEAPADVDIFVHDAPIENLIRESDLETDETETDEDFYDYNPAREANRILAEKRHQLLANLNGSETIVSSPSVVSEKPQSPKKKSKLKKKRSQYRANATRGYKKKNPVAVGAVTNIAVAPFARSLASDSAPDSSAKLFYETPTTQAFPHLRTEDSVISSGEGDSKRPKRKRVPLKFYGFSSDDETEATSGSRKREKAEHNPTTPIALSTDPGASPVAWNIHSKPMSWRIEKNEGNTPKVNPIKIKTSQAAKHNPVLDTTPAPEFFQSKRPDRAFQVNGNPTGNKGEKLYCFCQCPYDEVSEMIACDAEDCVIEWFHFECVGIMVPPKGSWYCPECRKKLAAENEFLTPPVTDQNAD